VRECRNLWVTPQVAQNLGRKGGSAIALKRIPAARLTFAVGLIFQQTQMFLERGVSANVTIPPLRLGFPNSGLRLRHDSGEREASRIIKTPGTLTLDYSLSTDARDGDACCPVT
jgi:hypothetical protein